MNKEEVKKNVQKLLELNEPLLVPQLASKLQKYAKIIYLCGLIILAISLISSFILLFTNPMAAFITLLFVFLEFVILRMFCEFLVSYNK